MDHYHNNKNRIAKNKRCSPCMCCIIKKIKTCKIPTVVNKSEVIMNDNTSDNTCDHVCKHHELKVNNNNY